MLEVTGDQEHGKCVHPNSRLIFSDGPIITAEELFSLAEKKGKKFEEKSDQIIYDIRNLDIKLPSLNKETGEIETKQVELAWQLNGGKLVRIKLRNNKAISTTPEHKYLVFENDCIMKKEAWKLKISDKVVCPREINNYKEEIQEILNSDGTLSLIKSAKYEHLDFVEIGSITEDYSDIVYDFTVKDNHNFVAEGMFISNTTFSDNLLLGAGMISDELTGKACVMDFHEDEKERGITIDAANVSMIHKTAEGQPYLINLIDTPGHVDFGGDVTRAMRAIDGSIVLVDAVEGIMPQTETVIKQALRERVKPVLFINKVDRLIREVKLTPEKMQERFLKIISDVNKLIYRLAPEEFKEKWQVNVQEGSVTFGSAIHKWALSFPYMQSNNISFKNVIDAYLSEKHEELAKIAPLHRIILNMSIKHHPNPKEAQKYRVPKLWHGDLESEEGKPL